MTINLELTSKEHKDLISYCELNKLDPDVILKKSYLEGFSIEKYGLLGNSSGVREKQVVKEIIVEKRVEIPVEVIKEVIKVEYVEVEKPVEKIVEVIKEIPSPPQEIEVIKYVDREVVKEVKVEVPVEKIVYIYDKKEENSVPNIDKIGDKPEPIIIEKIVEVIKEVDVSGSKVLMLQETLNKLRKELTDKNTRITELEGTIKKLEQTNINQGAVFMKGSNLTQNL